MATAELLGPQSARVEMWPPHASTGFATLAVKVTLIFADLSPSRFLTPIPNPQSSQARNSNSKFDNLKTTVAAKLDQAADTLEVIDEIFQGVVRAGDGGGQAHIHR